MNAPAPALDLPHSLEAEQAVLGAIFISKGEALHLVSDLLSPEHFHEELHARIYDAARTLMADGKPVSPLTVRPLLPAGLSLGDMSLLAYLAHLAAEAVTVSEARAVAETIFDHWRRRQLLAVAGDVVVWATDPPQGVDVDALVGEATERIRAIERPAKGRGSVTITEAATEALKSGATKGLTTGLHDLDAATGGLHGSDLIVIGGRPGMGKTSFALRLALAASSAGAGVLLFSMEMPARQLGARALTDLAFDGFGSIPYADLLNGSAAYDHQLEQVFPHFARLRLEIDDRSRLSPAQIETAARRTRARMEKQGVRLGLIVVDYLQLMRAGDRYKGERVHEVTEQSAAMKALAKDLDLPVVILSQLSRSVESRTDKRPMLSDLRESGSIEQDADMVIFLYREAYYLAKAEEQDPDKEEKRLTQLRKHERILEAIIAKQRNGPTRTVTLFYDPPSSAIRNAAKQLGGFV